MANTQNEFGSRNRPARLETTSQIVRRQRLNKAFRKADRAEKQLKKLGVGTALPQQTQPQKRDNIFVRFFKWLFRKG